MKLYCIVRSFLAVMGVFLRLTDNEDHNKCRTQTLNASSHIALLILILLNY